jgi:cell wall assembly regulator SMI1
MLPKDLKETRVETINSIRTKLSKYKMFNYLSNPEFAPSNESVTNTFNIRPDYRSLAQNSSLTKNPFWIPIPLDKKVSKISNKEFYTASQKAIDLLPTYNKTYGEIINKILEKMDKNTLSELLTIIALLETGQTI